MTSHARGAHPLDHLAVELQPPRGLAGRGIADMDVRDRGPGLRRLDRGRGDLLGRHRDRRMPADGVAGTGHGAGDDDLAVHDGRPSLDPAALDHGTPTARMQLIDPAAKPPPPRADAAKRRCANASPCRLAGAYSASASPHRRFRQIPDDHAGQPGPGYRIGLRNRPLGHGHGGIRRQQRLEEIDDGESRLDRGLRIARRQMAV